MRLIDPVKCLKRVEGETTEHSMKINHTVTYTIQAGPSPVSPRYENTTNLVHDRKLTTRGIQRILCKRICKGLIVTRVETAVLA